MKKYNLKKIEKTVRKAKPSAKGVILKSAKKENRLWLYGFAARMVKSFRQTALPYDDTVIRYDPRKRKPNNNDLVFFKDMDLRHLFIPEPPLTALAISHEAVVLLSLKKIGKGLKKEFIQRQILPLGTI